jgi:preprotein translocase subunit SecE
MSTNRRESVARVGVVVVVVAAAAVVVAGAAVSCGA